MMYVPLMPFLQNHDLLLFFYLKFLKGFPSWTLMTVFRMA